MSKRIGIDIGRVLIDRGDKGDERFAGGNYINAPEVPGATDAVRRLVASFGAENVFHVSKAGLDMQARTLAWMDHRDYFAITGMPRENVRFCLERDGKVAICRDLGITHMIDDRLEVLVYLADVVPCRFLFRPRAVDDRPWYDRWTNELGPLWTWEEVLRLVM